MDWLAFLKPVSIPGRTRKVKVPKLACRIYQKLTYIAELALLQEEQKPDFSVFLLQIVATPQHDDVTRLASALYFKNFIKKWWTVRKSGLHPEPKC